MVGEIKALPTSIVDAVACTSKKWRYGALTCRHSCAKMVTRLHAHVTVLPAGCAHPHARSFP